MIDSVTQITKQRRSETYFRDKIWEVSVELAHKSNIDVTAPVTGRRTRVPSRLASDYIVESSGGSPINETVISSAFEAYKVAYYEVIDKVLVELHHRICEHQAIAALSPQSPFLDLKVLLPLIEAYKLDKNLLSNQLGIARVTLQDKVDTEIEALGKAGVFSEAAKLFQIALTIPVASASAERSFSVLNRVKTYLRATMSEQRLNDLSVLAIERDLSSSQSLDYERVSDFMSQHPRRIILKC